MFGHLVVRYLSVHCTVQISQTWFHMRISMRMMSDNIRDSERRRESETKPKPESERETKRKPESFRLRIQYWWYPIFKSHVYNCNINLWKLVLLLTWINDSVDNILAIVHIVRSADMLMWAEEKKDIFRVLIVEFVTHFNSLFLSGAPFFARIRWDFQKTLMLQLNVEHCLAVFAARSTCVCAEGCGWILKRKKNKIKPAQKSTTCMRVCAICV